MNLFIYDNPSGYKININHPAIREYYHRYKDWKRIPQNCPLSHEERLEFEKYMAPILRRLLQGDEKPDEYQQNCEAL